MIEQLGHRRLHYWPTFSKIADKDAPSSLTCSLIAIESFQSLPTGPDDDLPFAA